jgi:hypothetical protein
MAPIKRSTDMNASRRSLRWFTCSPRDFLGNSIFFSRDNGLLCQGLKSLGVDCRAVILGQPRDDDFPDALRASWEQVTSYQWWQAHDLDGVALLSWGQPRYRPIIDAIRMAGCKVIHFTDTNGIRSPLAGPLAHLHIQFAYHWNKPLAVRILRALLSLPSGWLIDTWRYDPSRAAMIEAGDAFCAATPAAQKRFRRLVRIFGKDNGAEKVQILPFPVSFHFGAEIKFQKEDIVVAVGRWDSPQKRAPLLTATISLAAQTRPNTQFQIFGRSGDFLVQWHKKLPESVRTRVILAGIVPNEELANAYRRARVMLVSAAYEGCHVSSAEAVCSGATIVSCRSPLLEAVEWHASQQSGRTARRANPPSLTRALLEELEAWDQGQRDPFTIAESWRKVFLPNYVANKLLNIAGTPISPY